MKSNTFVASFGCWLLTAVAWAQLPPATRFPPATQPPATIQRPPATQPDPSADLRWRSTQVPAAGSGTPSAQNALQTLPIEPLRPVSSPTPQRIAKVTGGNGTLPNTKGQVWREYDITPYTLRVTSTARPEQAILDWILRETGHEAWHGESVAILSANRRRLIAYHTPEIQNVVGDIVDRFVSTEAETHAFSLRVVTVEKPNWRTRTQNILRPVPVESQGVQAWLLPKEGAAQLLAELSKRSDYREHSSPHLVVNNGQAHAIVATRPRSYVQGIALRAEAWPGYESQLGQYQEGFSVEISPLLSLDGSTIDAVIKCHIDQLEKLHPVMIEAHTPVAPRQRTRIDVPQTSQCRVQERFRWPADQVLLVSLGMVPSPVPAAPHPLLETLTGPPRSELLMLVESRGRLTGSTAAPPGIATQPKNYHGRY